MIDLPGFADPATGAQECFRAVLDATARPGSIHQAGACLSPPAPLDPATSAVLLTLADADTPVFMNPAHHGAREWAAFHCGCAFAATQDKAAFVVATGTFNLATLDAGTDEAPHDATTLVIQLAALGSGTPLRLQGPGLREPVTLHANGLPADFTAQWAANHALFPRGVDIILCAGNHLVALPRSLSITEG